ncbi:RNA polymerase sigma factor [Bacillus seohaeanensis]|uniref:RNA polymerase sigma factor n=1 Tax=Bacillus seohaeanensis TaxID=284580 RepID=A0ABW5RV73_9BACI
MDNPIADEKLIGQIYDKHFKDVYQFLIYFTGKVEDAEDLTQEVFLRVLKSYSHYNGQSTLKTWVFSIAKHVALDYHRKKKYYSIFKDGFFKKLASNDLEPAEVAENNEKKRLVREAMTTLKPAYRTVIILRGLNGLSIKQTAEVLGCSEEKVKVDYHRAIKKLKTKFNISTWEVLNNAN